MSKRKIWVVIPAAGIGSRMQQDRPKQYLQIDGKTVLEHTLSVFVDHPEINKVVVAISPSDQYWQTLKGSEHADVITVEGGKERCHSVLNALLWLETEAHPQDWVLVHDAARPCLSADDLSALIDQLRDDPVGGLLGTPVRDTMKRSDLQHRIAQTVERRDLWHALTPQMFRLGLLRRAIEEALAEGYVVSDEASAVEHLGLSPRMVKGRASNLKITLPEDLELAAFYLQKMRASTAVS